MIDKLGTKAADNYRLARSDTLYELADGTYGIIRIPQYAFVDQIWFFITQAYAGGAGGTATIGYAGNGETASTDGFMSDVIADARTAGMKIMTEGTSLYSVGKWFNTAGGLLTITLADATDTTLMVGTVFARYTVIH